MRTKWAYWYAWLIAILIGWLVLIVIVNLDAAPPAMPPGQAKKQGLDMLPPGLAKKLLTPPTPTPTPTPPSGATPTPSLAGVAPGLIAGVNASERAQWLAGRAQFQVTETAATGGGPLLNGTSCNACHGQPSINNVDAVGGAASNIEIHFLSPSFGNQLFHLSTTNPIAQDAIPADSVITIAHKSNTTSGLGLIDSIPDATIIAGVKDGTDGIVGRPAFLADPVTQQSGPNRVGRFGWKCVQASTTAFAALALRDELGVTNRLFGNDLPPNVPNGFALLSAAEVPPNSPNSLQDTPDNPALPESEDNPDRAEKLADFLRFNSAPTTVPLTPSALQGQALFTMVSCAKCHTPTMTTGVGVEGSLALTNQVIHPFSDFLLHHCGPDLGDGLPAGAAGPDEMRPAPLWGLRGRTTFLHDGRAGTVLAAILAHDAGPQSETTVSAQKFEALNATQQQAILDFLNSI